MKCVGPGTVEGTITAPPSKSAMVRAVAAAALAAGHSVIDNPADCDDGLAARRVAEGLGAGVEDRAGRLLIDGAGWSAPIHQPEALVLDCGESGLCMRLFAPIAALRTGPTRLEGHGSLCARPMGMVETALRGLGARCRTTDGTAPLEIGGPLQGGRLELDGAESSQLLSGLLFALPLCDQDSTLLVRDLHSAGYVALTIALLRPFGVTIHHDHTLSELRIPGRQQLQATTLTLGGDWSGAAFPLVAGAIAGSVRVRGLDLGSPQPDRAVLEALRRAGAAVEIDGDGVLCGHQTLQAFTFDATGCPDLIPPLAALACHCRGRSELGGAARLRHKESNRAQALARELGKMGAAVEQTEDRLLVTGSPLAGAQVDACGDHRIAMACAIAALGAAAEVCIDGERSVEKSYPAFFEDLTSLGARVS